MIVTQHAHIYSFHTSKFNFGEIFFLIFLSIQPLFMSHGAGLVGLHVRISNEAAVRLYCTEGCGVADIMPMYYGNRE